MLLTTIAIACLALAHVPEDVPGDVPLRTVSKGPRSLGTEPLKVAVRSAAEWEKLWTQRIGASPPEAVDFSKEMVLAVFLGTRPTAGYGVEIVRASRQNGRLTVRYIERAPPPGEMVAQVITMPYHIAAVPAVEGEVVFESGEPE